MNKLIPKTFTSISDSKRKKKNKTENKNTWKHLFTGKKWETKWNSNF